MRTRRRRLILGSVAAGILLTGASYLAQAALTWLRYGRTRARANGPDADLLLDRFLPVWDVVERYQLRVAAPANVALASASNVRLEDSRVLAAIFRTRALVMGGREARVAGPRELLASTLAMGWGVLAEVPGLEVVLGAVTRPWEADVVFRAVPAQRFAAFDEPGYVKIVWTLRADPVGDSASVLRTETRAVSTDAQSRARFRNYWSLVRPGVWLIRRIALRLAKEDAERRARAACREQRSRGADAGAWGVVSSGKPREAGTQEQP